MKTEPDSENKIPDAFLLVGPPSRVPEQKTSCFLWFHEWSPWEAPEKMKTHFETWSVDETILRRTCKRCRQVQIRKVTA